MHERAPELETALNLPWLEVVSLGGRLDVLALFGEAMVMACAKLEHGFAVLEDAVAVKLGREQGISVARTLNLVAGAVRKGILAVGDAETLVDELGAAGVDAIHARVASSRRFCASTACSEQAKNS